MTAHESASLECHKQVAESSVSLPVLFPKQLFIAFRALRGTFDFCTF